MAAVPSCSYPGCKASSGLERCANQDARFACATHRTLRNGGYVCLRCDEEEEAARQLAEREDSLRNARFGAIAIGVASVCVAYAGYDGTVGMRLVSAGGLAIAVLVAWAWFRSSGFLPPSVAALPDRERQLCQMIISAGTASVAVILVLFADLVAWAAERAARERARETIAEGVRRGIERTRY